MSLLEKQKSCPFCGAEAYLHECPNCGELNIDVTHRDGCWLLEWEGVFDVLPSDRDEYVESWNRRADDSDR